MPATRSRTTSTGTSTRRRFLPAMRARKDAGAAAAGPGFAVWPAGLEPSLKGSFKSMHSSFGLAVPLVDGYVEKFALCEQLFGIEVSPEASVLVFPGLR